MRNLDTNIAKREDAFEMQGSRGCPCGSAALRKQASLFRARVEQNSSPCSQRGRDPSLRPEPDMPAAARRGV
ncbi:hypothetical protein PBY51_015469 [Eleginops maclovinus]|uniref:Uncharacterized protein n=1 Tax=Eleginops maclovinus TaxID=56733 RepID=A0AAN8AGQ9_ELEMC|nr:hypothetical protein PBY51_015469 [Eleginops maclovinus]